MIGRWMKPAGCREKTDDGKSTWILLRGFTNISSSSMENGGKIPIIRFRKEIHSAMLTRLLRSKAMAKSEQLNDKQVMEGKIFAILSYLSILCIIPLVLKRDNSFVLSHGKQGLVLFIGEVTIFVISVVFDWILRPSIFVFGVFSLWGIIEALKGQYVRMPVVSDIADKITL